MKVGRSSCAEKSGLSQQAISQYARGVYKPGYDAIAALAQALEVEPNWFFANAATHKSPPQDKNEPQRTTQQPVPNPKSASILAFPPSGKITRGGTFVIGHYLPMQQMPPPTRANQVGIAAHFYGLIFDTLAQRMPSGEPRGVLAVDWKPIGNSWLFRLRTDAKFHDGTFLTTEDVIWSYNQYLSDNPRQPLIQGIEALDESWIRIHLNSSCQLEELPMPLIMSLGMEESPNQWIGTGPFQAVELKPGFWRLKSNPHYFFGAPYFDEVHIREYPSPEELEKALIEGEVHFANGIYLEDENVVAKAEAVAQRYHLHFLLDEPLATNLVLRKAIALALDKEAIAKEAGLRQPRFSSGPFDYLLGDWLQRPTPPDPQTAKLLLKQLPDLRSSVFRLRFDAAEPKNRLIANTIVEQPRHLGIPAEVGEPAHAFVLLRNVQLFEHECRLWSTSARQNVNGYSNPKVDELIQHHQDSLEVKNLYYELRWLIQEDLPDIPLFYASTPVSYVKSLRVLKDRVILFSGLTLQCHHSA